MGCRLLRGACAGRRAPSPQVRSRAAAPWPADVVPPCQATGSAVSEQCAALYSSSQAGRTALQSDRGWPQLRWTRGPAARWTVGAPRPSSLGGCGQRPASPATSAPAAGAGVGCETMQSLARRSHGGSCLGGWPARAAEAGSPLPGPGMGVGCPARRCPGPRGRRRAAAGPCAAARPCGGPAAPGAGAAAPGAEPQPAPAPGRASAASPRRDRPAAARAPPRRPSAARCAPLRRPPLPDLSPEYR